MEEALGRELEQLGAQSVRPLSAGVSFRVPSADVRAVFRVCLWSRLAARVTLVVARVEAADAKELYTGASSVAWEDSIAPGARVSVRAHGVNDALRNTRFTALKVKDAVVDRLRARGFVAEDGKVAASIDVRLRGARATLSLDLAGRALNHRPYLTSDDGSSAEVAVLRAAGLLALASWGERAGAGWGFADTACASGVLVTEAAAWACDCAPNLDREEWGFQGWAAYEEAVWEEERASARARFAAGRARMLGMRALDVADAGEGATSGEKGCAGDRSTAVQGECAQAIAGRAAYALDDELPDVARVRIAGITASSPALARARDRVRRAGLRAVVSIELGAGADAAALVDRVASVAVSRASAAEAAVLVACDFTDQAPSRPLALAERSAFWSASASAPAASAFALVGGEGARAGFGCEPHASARWGRDRTESRAWVFDRPPANLAQIEVSSLADGSPQRVFVLERSSEQFAARLRKVLKERRRWARVEGVSCYRLYDADLPGYACAIDVYSGSGRAKGASYLHVSEYTPPASIDADKARNRFDDALTIAPIVCGVRPEHVFAKTRRRTAGGRARIDERARSYVTYIEEGGYSFEVDLAGRLDTGIFLDHRPIRALIGAHARGARFLNLFAYTGTASVYAAGGGAVQTVTVDMSATYLDWAERNMRANGLTGDAHYFEQADVTRWVTEERRSGQRYDLVFVDVPTFSNSKAMGRRTWDVQRDHVELLVGVSRLLAPGGTAIFSCNLRTFKPDGDELARLGVALEDITSRTIPHDFARTPNVHRCFLMRRAEVERGGD